MWTSLARRTVVGIDIGSSAVRAAVLTYRRGGWTLAAAGEAAIATDETDHADAAELASSAAIAELMGRLHLRRPRAIVALPGRVTVLTRLTLPRLPKRRLAAAVREHAAALAPFSLEDASVDYHLLPPGTDPRPDVVTVLVAAARREDVVGRAETVAQAGCRPVAVDIEALALANAHAVNYPEHAGAWSLLVHLDRRATTVSVLDRGVVAYSVPLDTGGASSEALTAAIRRAVDSERRPTIPDTSGHVVVSGDAHGLPDLVTRLATAFTAPAHLFDPVRHIRCPPAATGADLVGPSFSVAVGLAMRGRGDR